jgi:hypothetical protein
MQKIFLFAFKRTSLGRFSPECKRVLNSITPRLVSLEMKTHQQPASCRKHWKLLNNYKKIFVIIKRYSKNYAGLISPKLFL